MFPSRKYKDYSIYPPEDTAKIDTNIRLLITYNDIFGNKYLVIFDWSKHFGWRQYEEIKSIDQRLDEYFVEKRATHFAHEAMKQNSDS